jgi:hypothetical protein
MGHPGAMTGNPYGALIRAQAEQRRRQRAMREAALRLLVRNASLPTRVFISFDSDQMRFEAAALGAQLRQSPRFSVENWSMKEAAPERLWPREAEKRLSRSDVMLIVVNGNTWAAQGVVTEVEIAQGLRIPIRMIHPERIPRPKRVPAPGAPLRAWTHDNLAELLAVPRRRATP